MNDEIALPDEAAEEVVPSQETETPEAAESTEGQDADPPAEGEKPEDKSEAQKRRERRNAYVAKLRESEAEAKARADEAERRLAERREMAKKLERPTQRQNETYEDYQARLTAHYAMTAMDEREMKALEAQAAAEVRQLEAARQQQQAEAAQNWAAHVAEAKQRYADFEAVVNNPSLPIPSHVAELIATSDAAGEVAYYLGKNPDIAAQLADMRGNPLALARAFGRIEAQVSAPKPKSVSSAPPPIRPVSAPSATASKDPSKMSFSEWREARAKGWTP